MSRQVGTGIGDRRGLRVQDAFISVLNQPLWINSAWPSPVKWVPAKAWE